MPTSLKKKIMDKLMITQKVKLTTQDKAILTDGISVGKSILFSQVHITKKEQAKAQSVGFENLPFNDFMVLADLESHNAETDTSNLIEHGVLYRIKRLNETQLRVFLYGNRRSYEFTIIAALDIDIATGQYKRAAPLRDEDWFSEYFEHMMRGVRESIWAITNFQPTGTITPTITFAMKKKIRPEDIPTYIEYTLDLAKAKPYPKSSLGGSHASPCEHVRRGHWRRLRNGKMHFVEATVVNEGSKRGKVEKDYQL